MFSTIKLEVKLEFVVQVSQENKLLGAVYFDGRRLFTRRKCHGESNIQEFNHGDKTFGLFLQLFLKFKNIIKWSIVIQVMKSFQDPMLFTRRSMDYNGTHSSVHVPKRGDEVQIRLQHPCLIQMSIVM